MAIFYFETIIERLKPKEGIDSIDKLLDKWASENEFLAPLIRNVTKEEFLQNRGLLLKPVSFEKQKLYLELLNQYMISVDKGSDDLEPDEKIGHKESRYLSTISSETNIPGHILRESISSIDNLYNADKYLASRYVDKFSQECFTSWLNHLPEKNALKDVLDLVVITVVQYRGCKLKGKFRRFTGRILLRIIGQK